MTNRIASGVLASSLMRTAYAVGGSAAVLAKGDVTAGAILLITSEKGVVQGFLARVHDREGRYFWASKSLDLVKSKQAIDDYVARECRRDPDMWVIELDVPNVQRFTAELATGD